MKFLVVTAVLVPYFAEGSRVRARAEESSIVQGLYRLLNSSKLLNTSLFGVRSGAAAGTGSPHFGHFKCPCIGIDDLDGTTVVHTDGRTLKYPADTGARCEAWDEDNHHDCEGGGGPDWCQQSWCYVDPCTCDIGVPSKPSTYMEGAKYRGKPVHYSYATCGGTDTYTSDEVKKQLTDNKALCAKPVDEKVWGKIGCQCIGIDSKEGETMMHIDGKLIPYPSSAGASCNAWDEKSNPECTGANAPVWCKERWCYVDPCFCDRKTSPKESVYLEEGEWQDRPMYYSYTACGSEDHFTEPNPDACPQHYDKASCEKESNELWCEWEDVRGVCLGKELTAVCGEVGGSGGWAHSAAHPSLAGARTLATAVAAGVLSLL